MPEYFIYIKMAVRNSNPEHLSKFSHWFCKLTGHIHYISQVFIRNTKIHASVMDNRMESNFTTLSTTANTVKAQFHKRIS